MRSKSLCLVSAHFPLKTELIVNTHTAIVDIRQDVSKIRDHIDGEDRVVSGVEFFIVSQTDSCLVSKRVSNLSYQHT